MGEKPGKDEDTLGLSGRGSRVWGVVRDWCATGTIQGRSWWLGFWLLTSNYVVRPLRDEMGIAGGVSNLPWLFLGSLVMVLTLAPLFAWAAKRWGRWILVPAIYRLAVVCLLAFTACWWWIRRPMGLGFGFGSPGTSDADLGGLTDWFFLWASVFNLLSVSLFWSLMTDAFRVEPARSVLGAIAVGNTLGAIVGSVVAQFLPPFLLPLVAALTLERAARMIPPLRAELDRLPTFQPAEIRRHKHHHASASQPQTWSDLIQTLRSPGVLGLSLYILLFTISSTFLYFEQARIIAAARDDPAERTALFARMDFLVNVVGLFAHGLFVRGGLTRFGPGVTAAFLPAVTLLGSLWIGWKPDVFAIVCVQVTRRGLALAVARPNREALFAALERGDQYRAKCFIDTAVYRLGDAMGAWLYPLAAQSLGITSILVVITSAWIALSLALGARAQHADAHAHAQIHDDPIYEHPDDFNEDDPSDLRDLEDGLSLDPMSNLTGDSLGIANVPEDPANPAELELELDAGTPKDKDPEAAAHPL